EARMNLLRGRRSVIAGGQGQLQGLARRGLVAGVIGRQGGMETWRSLSRADRPVDPELREGSGHLLLFCGTGALKEALRSADHLTPSPDALRKRGEQI